MDISEEQIRRARERVPQAEFVRADATDASFGTASFDAVVSLFALIHLPLSEQPSLLRKIAGWLRPGGCFVATTGHGERTGTEENWLGGGAPMWWSHADAATNRGWIEQVGLTEVLVGEPDVEDLREAATKGDGLHGSAAEGKA